MALASLPEIKMHKISTKEGPLGEPWVLLAWVGNIGTA